MKWVLDWIVLGWLRPYADIAVKSESDSLSHRVRELQQENELLRRQIELWSHSHDVNLKMLDHMAYVHGMKSAEKS